MVNLSPAQLVLSASSLFVNAPSGSISSVSLEEWKKLHRQVAGRLYLGAPFARPCFTNTSLGVSDPACSVVQHGYVDERTSFIHITINRVDDVNMNSDTLERIWSVYQHSVGDVSGHWSSMSPRLYEPI